MTRRHYFSPEDDALFHAQQRGEITLHQLCLTTFASREAVHRRATELGLTILVGKRKRRMMKPPERPASCENGQSNRMEGDPLYDRLMKLHPNRRFNRFEPIEN